MIDEAIAAIVGLVVAVVFAVKNGVTDLIKQWFENKRNRNKEDVIAGLEKLCKMHEAFQEIMEIERVHRVLIFSGTNSGGLPRIDSPFYCEALHGACKGDLCRVDPMERHGTKRKIDRQYIEMLLEMEKNGRVLLSFETMPDCKLKGYYLDEGVRHAGLWYIGIIDSKFIYISIATYSDENFTEKDLIQIELQIDILRVIMSE